MISLDPIERRVIGVLLEKLLATPHLYPLTLNALVAGCNQKNNREPRMALEEGRVARTLEGLRQKGYVAREWPEGARVEKWRCRFHEWIGVTGEREMAILAELLLRGPQSKSELRTRASRMRHALTHEDVERIIEAWRTAEEPLIIELPPGPGQRRPRVTHAFYGPDELAALRSPSEMQQPPEQAAGLLERIEALERRVAALEARLSADRKV